MSTYHKILLGLIAAAYLISPVDIIPDFLIPYIGWLDDTFIIGMIIYYLKRGKFPDLFYKKRKETFQSQQRKRSTTQGSAQQYSSSNSSSSSKESTSKKERSGQNRSSVSGQDHHFRENSSQGDTKQSKQKNSRQQSPHEILGIPSGASREEIMAAYRRGVKQYHPDRVTHLGKELQELASRKFIEIKEAYNTLMKNS